MYSPDLSCFVCWVLASKPLYLLCDAVQVLDRVLLDVELLLPLVRLALTCLQVESLQLLQTEAIGASIFAVCIQLDNVRFMNPMVQQHLTRRLCLMACCLSVLLFVCSIDCGCVQGLPSTAHQCDGRGVDDCHCQHHCGGQQRSSALLSGRQCFYGTTPHHDGYCTGDAVG